jgi:HSP20 family protein
MNIIKKKGKGNGQSAVAAKPAETQISRFRHELEDAFDRAFRGMERDPWRAFEVGLPWPPTDISETDKALTVRLDVPGLSAEDLEVQLSGNTLTVRGERSEEQKEEKGETYRHERYTGSFARTITIPSYADADKADATYDKGVLTITLPKIEGVETKRVAVKNSGT